MKLRTLSILLASSVAMVLAGCAGQRTTTTTASTMDTDTQRITEQSREIARLESQLREKERMIAANEAKWERTSSSRTSSSSDLFPPNPKAGECYARVMIPAQYKTTTEKVVKREASESIEIIPAKYGTVEERVLVREASTRLETVPAKYKTVTERVLDKPAHTMWKRGPTTAQTGNVLNTATTDTGEIMCLVEVPASYKTITKQVLVQPASTKTVTIPAEYKTIKKTVVTQPAQERRIPIEAQWDTVTKRTKISDEQLEWRRVWCDVNLTRENVTALQTALKKAGYYRGPVDGIIGPMTLGASNAYAKAKNLPLGSNYIPVEVARSLDVRL